MKQKKTYQNNNNYHYYTHWHKHGTAHSAHDDGDGLGHVWIGGKLQTNKPESRAKHSNSIVWWYWAEAIETRGGGGDGDGSVRLLAQNQQKMCMNKTKYCLRDGKLLCGQLLDLKCGSTRARVQRTHHSIAPRNYLLWSHSAHSLWTKKTEKRI